MGRYSSEFKQSMIQKLLLPGGPSATALAETSGVSQATLSRWLREAASVALVANDTDRLLEACWRTGLRTHRPVMRL
ncbi:MAG: transposase [Polyangiaceae bacterium]|nr:transposase [Polyangiaceae bacterium]